MPAPLPIADSARVHDRRYRRGSTAGRGVRGGMGVWRAWAGLGTLLILSWPGAGQAGERLGLDPLEIADPRPVDSQVCGECHHQIYQEWSQSRHRQSWSNALLQAAYIFETKPFCVRCHAPLVEQAAEISANAAWYRALDPRQGILPIPEKKPETRAADGIDCLVCHWREGAALGPGLALDSPHPTRQDPSLSDPRFCASCHDFEVPGSPEGAPVAMQQTGAEHQRWLAAGGSESCVDCHMPGGSHSFRGAHDVAWLRQSVQVEAQRIEGQARWSVSTRGVGHHLPTGDIFREIQLQIKVGESWQILDRMGRELDHMLDPQTGRVEPREARDTALRPAVPRLSTSALPGEIPWQLRYLYTTSGDVERGLLASDRVAVILHQGVIPAKVSR